MTAGRRCFGHREVEGFLALVLVGGVFCAAQFAIVSTALGRGAKVEFAFDRGRRGRVFVLALAMEVAEIESAIMQATLQQTLAAAGVGGVLGAGSLENEMSIFIRLVGASWWTER